MDKMQKLFHEIKTLHAELHESNDKALQYMNYLKSMSEKVTRLQALNDALHTAMDCEKREDDGEECVYWTAIEDEANYTVTNFGYSFYLEDIEDLETRYLKEKMEDELSNNSTISKRTKI